MWFRTGTEVKETELSDVTAYNHAKKIRAERDGRSAPVLTAVINNRQKRKRSNGKDYMNPPPRPKKFGRGGGFFR